MNITFDPWFVLVRDELVGVYFTKREAVKEYTDGYALPKKYEGGYDLRITDESGMTRRHFICRTQAARENGYDWAVDEYYAAMEQIHIVEDGFGAYGVGWKLPEDAPWVYDQSFPYGIKPRAEWFSRQDVMNECNRIAVQVAATKMWLEVDALLRPSQAGALAIPPSRVPAPYSRAVPQNANARD